MQKWEYLKVEQSAQSKLFGRFDWYIYVNDQQLPDSKNYSLMQYVNELGRQGWEMVGCGNITEFRHAIYFKRVKPY